MCVSRVYGVLRISYDYSAAAKLHARGSGIPCDLASL